MDFEEQIDKRHYYEQQGFGNSGFRIPQKYSRQKGRGFGSFARRFAYPVIQSFMKIAKPVARDIFSEVKSVAQDTLKNKTVKKLKDLISSNQNGNSVKRKRSSKKKTQPAKKTKSSKRKQPKKKKIVKKKNKKTVSRKQLNDIFK